MGHVVSGLPHLDTPCSMYRLLSDQLDIALPCNAIIVFGPICFLSMNRGTYCEVIDALFVPMGVCIYRYLISEYHFIDDKILTFMHNKCS